jgi:BASS family bile acid:Na+ symporter
MSIMRLAELIPIVFQASIFLVVAAFGLKARAQGPIFARRGGLLLRALVALYVIVPIITIITVYVLDPIRPVKIALILLAISPVPPFLPAQQFKLSRDESFITSLFVASALLAIVSVPASINAIDSLTDLGLSIPMLHVARTVVMSVLLPLAVGIAIFSISPSFAARAEPIASKLGTVLLLIVAALVLFATRRALFTLIGDGTIIIIALVIGLALLIGHMMGGPDDQDRVVLALSSAARHPGVAMGIAAYNFPADQSISAAVLLYLVLNTLFSLPYKTWWKRSHPVPQPQLRRPLLH